MNIKKLAYLFVILIFSISFFAQTASAQPSKNNVEDFVASEMEYIIQAQQSINKLSNKEMRDLETDRLTGKPWSEVEQQIRPSVHESKSSQLSQADFLAAESDYITKRSWLSYRASCICSYCKRREPGSNRCCRKISMT